MKPSTEPTDDKSKNENETRALETAGEKRRAAMISEGVESYRSLRARLNGSDVEEVRAAHPTDEFSMDWLPEGRDVGWDEFVRLAVQRKMISAWSPGLNTSVEGFLLFLQANRLVTATGGRRHDLKIRRLPEPRAKMPSGVQFVPDPASVDPWKRLDELERRIQRIEANVLV